MMHQHKDGVYYMSRDSVAKHVAKLEAENEAFGDFANTIAYTSDGKRRSGLGLTFTKALEDLRNVLLTTEESE